MSNYFEDVYLKRMNRDGTTLQERVRTRKEIKFDECFSQKTKYSAALYQVNDEQVNYPCAVEPSKWGQDKMISNILVSRSAPTFECGDIIYTYQKIKNNEYDKTWLICYVDEDITRGYQKYEAIELDIVLNHTDEYGNTIHLIPAKFVSETSVFVQDKFSSYGSVSYREPLAHRKFLTRDFDFLKKSLYFDYKDRGWEIVGIDNISIPGVAYVSVAESLVSPPEPETSADILVGEDNNFFLNH